MDPPSQLDAVLELLERVGIPWRKERLGGAGGGLCTLRGERIVFIDLDADLATQVDHCVRALAAMPEVDSMYVIPALRERIDQARNAEAGSS